MKYWAIALVLFVSSWAYSVGNFWPGTVLSSEQVKAKWGDEKLDIRKFKTGSTEVRAKMVYDLIQKQKTFIGKSEAEIKTMFGEHDGYYFNDSIPAYIIQEGANSNEPTWQVVFLPGRDRKIEKIIVHKNCCG